MGPKGELRHLGPYVVHSRLGRGGMGEVYKAYDDRLDRWVAIKRIRPDKEEAAEHRNRLRREARAAARLNHPAIVHVYDIFDDHDSDCIVMELVEGTSLDQLIQTGPLDPERVARIGRQIATGLAEAHEKGILHRDLKTENVIITADDQPKILDFGLAKPLIQGDLDSTLTGKGQVVGTSRTMSPEYVSGDAVDHRSDLFSLGVLLYESATAKSPFKAHNTLATLKRVILHRQPPANELNPAVPEPLSLLIDQLLEKEPADRPPTAVDVAEALAHLTDGSSSAYSLGSTGSFAALPRRATRRRRWWAAAAALAIVAGLGTSWVVMREPAPDVLSGPDAAGPSLLILGDFVNRTGEEVLDDSLTFLMRAGLEQSAAVHILSSQQVGSILKRMALPADTPINEEVGIEIAQREGALGVVVGQIVKVGETYALSVELVDAQSDRRLFATTETAPDRSSILTKMRDVVSALRADLGETAARIQASGAQLEKVTTSNLEALRAYSRGIDSFNKSAFPSAISLFQRAVDLDPQFAMAHAKLGTSYHNNREDLEKVAFHFQLALDAKERLAPDEELYVQGWMATWFGTPDEMLRAWDTMRGLEPTRAAGHNNYALTQWLHFHRFEEAVTAMKEAISHARSDRPFMMVNLGYCQLALGDLDDALISFGQSQAREQGFIGQMNVELGRGALPAAERALRQARAVTDGSEEAQHDLRFNELQLALGRGQVQEATNAAAAGFERARMDGSVRWEQAFLVARIAVAALHQDRALLISSLEAGMDRATALMEEDPLDLGFSPIPLLGLLGKLAARAGLEVRAEDMLALINPIAADAGFPSWFSYASMLEAELLAARGSAEAASEALRRGVERFETFQIHETMAFVAQKSGDQATATEELAWLASNGGRALAECPDLCFDRGVNIIDWILAYAKLAELRAAEHDWAAAQRNARKFLAFWGTSDEPNLPFVEPMRELAAR